MFSSIIVFGSGFFLLLSTFMLRIFSVADPGSGFSYAPKSGSGISFFRFPNPTHEHIFWVKILIDSNLYILIFSSPLLCCGWIRDLGSVIEKNATLPMVSSYILWQVRKRGNRRDPNVAGAGQASDTDSALEDSASDTDSEAADTDPDQSDADAADGRPKKKGNIIIQDKVICCRTFSLCLRTPLDERGCLKQLLLIP